jgi:hypothetical protein
MTIDTTNMCSHLQRKLFAEEAEYRYFRADTIDQWEFIE